MILGWFVGILGAFAAFGSAADKLLNVDDKRWLAAGIAAAHDALTGLREPRILRNFLRRTLLWLRDPRRALVLGTISAIVAALSFGWTLWRLPSMRVAYHKGNVARLIALAAHVCICVWTDAQLYRLIRWRLPLVLCSASKRLLAAFALFSYTALAVLVILVVDSAFAVFVGASHGMGGIWTDALVVALGKIAPSSIPISATLLFVALGIRFLVLTAATAWLLFCLAHFCWSAWQVSGRAILSRLRLTEPWTAESLKAYTICAWAGTLLGFVAAVAKVTLDLCK